MTHKKLMVMSVAAACAWPVLAEAHWEVATPSSVDESAPHLATNRSHLGAPAASMQAQTAPVAVERTATYMAEQTTSSASELRAGQARARRASMPNPQTPWSPNESGTNHFAQDMQSYRQHVASLEQARTTAANSYAPLIVIAEAPPPAPETPVASAEPAAARSETAAVSTEAPARRADTSLANTPVANAEAAADVDRLLRNSDAPQDRPREAVATLSPVLVDTRQSATSDLRIETTGNDSGGNASGSVAQPQPEGSTQIGGTSEPATVATVAGSSGSMSASSAGQSATTSAVELPPAPQATSTAPEATAAGQTGSGTPAQ